MVCVGVSYDGCACYFRRPILEAPLPAFYMPVPELDRPSEPIEAAHLRAVINGAARGPLRARYTDLILAAGLVAVVGETAFNMPLQVAASGVLHEGATRYQIMAPGRSAAVWAVVFHVEFRGPGDWEILLHREGAWEGALLQWAFRNEGAVSRVAEWSPAEVALSVGTQLRPQQSFPPASEEEIRGRILRHEEREGLKSRAWPILLDREVSVESRSIAALLLLRAWFDRSLWGHLERGDLLDAHPDFAGYVSMMLYHRRDCETLFGDPAVVDHLCAIYGIREGLPAGTSYWSGGGTGEGWGRVHADFRPFGVEDLPESFPDLL